MEKWTVDWRWSIFAIFMQTPFMVKPDVHCDTAITRCEFDNLKMKPLMIVLQALKPKQDVAKAQHTTKAGPLKTVQVESQLKSKTDDKKTVIEVWFTTAISSLLIWYGYCCFECLGDSIQITITSLLTNVYVCLTQFFCHSLIDNSQVQ